MAKSEQDEKHLPHWILFLQRQGPALWDAKWPVLVLLVGTATVTYSFVDHGYKATLAAKDATIQTKDAIIDQQKKQMERAGVSSSPLKTRALILSKQLVEAANNLPTNSVYPYNGMDDLGARFGVRLEKIRGELDERGQRIERLDKLVSTFGMVPGNMKKDEVLQMATDIKTLAENIKD